MPLEEEKLNQNEWVRWLLNKDHNRELWKILGLWEKYKREWEEMRMKFWRKWSCEKYVNLILQYNDSKRKYIKNLTRKEREILDRLNGVWKDKFIEGYMHNKILYSGNADEKMERNRYRYNWEVIMEEWIILDLSRNNIWDGWAEVISKMELKEWVKLDLEWNGIWDVWAEAISKMELKEWVYLNLYNNNICDEWAEAISIMGLKEWVYLDLSENHIQSAWAEAISKMKLKKWVWLDLSANDIWAEWAEAISKMELEEWVYLGLSANNICDEWAEAILKMELEEWVSLDLRRNDISKKMRDKLNKWVQEYKKRWVDCEVFL